MSNFTEVSHLNEVMGNHKGDALTNFNRAHAQFEIIQEELTELHKALYDRNFTEIRDGIADVLVTTYGLSHLLGINADDDMKEVQSSNMSKLCVTELEAAQTIEKYESMGVMVSTRGDAPEIAIYSNCSQSDSNGKYYPEGKFLKSINFKEPVFK